MHFSSIDCAIIIIISVLYDQWGEAQASKQPISIQPNQIGSSYSYFATTTAFMSAISSTIPSGASSAPICFEKEKKARARKELTTRFTMVDHYVPNIIFHMLVHNLLHNVVYVPTLISQWTDAAWIWDWFLCAMWIVNL